MEWMSKMVLFRPLWIATFKILHIVFLALLNDKFCNEKYKSGYLFDLKESINKCINRSDWS